MTILKLLKLADLFTIANLCSGLLSVFFAIRGLATAAALSLLLAVLFDWLDGKVAGLLKQKNLFGKQLDSLSDLVSFGVAPAVLYFTLSSRSVYIILALLFFVVCGMLRLARYNISKQKGFQGVPVTANGLVFPFFLFLSFIFPQTLQYWPLLFVIMGFLMVSSFRIKRVF